MSRRRRWLRVLLGVCLRAWPVEARRREGPALLAAVDDQLAEPGTGALEAARIVAGEAVALVSTGISLRVRAVARAILSSEGVLEDAARDVRLALRSLARSPTFTAAAVLTLALGIGANAAVLGLVDRVLLRPPPFSDPGRVVLVWGALGSGGGRLRIAAPDVGAVAERAGAFDGVAFLDRVRNEAIVADDEAGAEHITLATVTPNLFDVLGVDAALGRALVDGDRTDMGDGVGSPVVLSDGLWRRVFGADPAVLGRTVRVGGRASTVVGVMSAGFRVVLPPDVGIVTDVDVWRPLPGRLDAYERGDGRLVDQDSDNTGVAIARLREGSDMRSARAELERIAAELRREVPAYAEADLRLVGGNLHDQATEHARPILLVVLAGAALMLLVTCIDVSTLLLARGARRRGEMALRVALGAGRARVVRQLLTESLVLVALGSALGCAVAWVAAGALSSLTPADLSGGAGAAIGWRAFVGASALAGIATVAFGAGPSLWSAAHPRTSSIGASLLRTPKVGTRLRGSLVVAQVALSVVLALGAGLLLRSVSALGAVKPGFDPEGALAFNVTVRVPGRYRGPADRARLARTIETRLRDLPRVSAVGLAGVLPLTGGRWTQPYGLPGQAEHEWQGNRADFRVITSGYLDAIGSRVLEGRGFAPDEDLSEERRVALVDETLAHRLAPAGSAVGSVIGIPLDGSAVQARVVGVVENVRSEDLRADGIETVYVPYRQEASREVSFVVRGDGDPSALAPAVRRVVREVDDQLPVYAMRPLAGYVDAQVAPSRLALSLLAAFALLSLMSAAVGLYGVLAFEVGRRTAEIGVRMAVGASRGEVLRAVLSGGLRRCALGIGVGVAASALAATSLRALVFGVAVTDPVTWSAVIAAVLAVAGAGCWVPARRASRLDPTAALRAE